MSRWIVFITAVHEEIALTAVLRTDGERSVVTYPLVVVPAKEIAEIVVARLNHLHGVPEASGSDDWQEFSFKADSDLNPQEFAMSLDLNDPAYPRNGRYPKWLVETVSAAKTALKEASRRSSTPTSSDGAVYLFASPKAETTSATVFHRAKSRSNADALSRLFAKEYLSNGTAAFHLRAASALAPEERLLLDEAIDELAVYDDPDPGAYDPPASKEVLARAEYSRRADRWEARLSEGKSGTAHGTSMNDRINDLLRAVERHRLMFLYWAAARRRNPLAIGSRTGINERVFRDDVRGWKEMVEAIDSDGEFLWTHRDVLDRYAQEAIGAFGPGEGMRPGEPDASGRSVPVEGGTLPYWSLDEESTRYLEETSDAIQDACCSLAEVGQIEAIFSLVKDASAAARAEHHDRWYANVIVKWSYLSALDSLISRIKALRVELAMPARSTGGNTSQSTSAKPHPQHVADLVVLLMVARDLIRIGLEYPDAMPVADHNAWVEEVTSQAEVLLNQPGLESIKTFMKSPAVLVMDVAQRLGIVMSTTMMLHPSLGVPADVPAEVQRAVERVMDTCQTTASKPVQSHLSRLATLMVVSCRCPTGTDNKDFAQPARFFQMLDRYWVLASLIVQTQSSVPVGFTPHPLLHLIENIRDRLDTCFSGLKHIDGITEAKRSCDQLFQILAEGDIDDLSMVPEWTNRELLNVERLIARIRLKIGSREFVLTTAEEFFIKQAEHLIAEHDKRCRAAWKQMLAKADAKAAARQPVEITHATSGPAVVSHPTTSPEQGAERIGPLLSSLVAADNGVMSLGARLRSMAVRGKSANTYALTVKVQEQLHKWIDPITQHLKDAEKASHGVGPHLIGLIAEPLAWEVDTRLAIRTLIDQLVGLIISNGGEIEETLVVSAASSLSDRGQHLQAAFEALNAQTHSSNSYATSGKSSRPPHPPAQPVVLLGRRGDPCTVNGKQKPPLTDGQYEVVQALIEAGEQGLKKDSIQRVRPSALRMLDDLRADPDWATVIVKPGQTNGRYRIRLG
jgi:hypothetical protein